MIRTNSSSIIRGATYEIRSGHMLLRARVLRIGRRGFSKDPVVTVQVLKVSGIDSLRPGHVLDLPIEAVLEGVL